MTPPKARLAEPETRLCGQCFQEFETTLADKRFCSSRCGRLALRLEHEHLPTDALPGASHEPTREFEAVCCQCARVAQQYHLRVGQRVLERPACRTCGSATLLQEVLQ